MNGVSQKFNLGHPIFVKIRSQISTLREADLCGFITIRVYLINTIPNLNKSRLDSVPYNLSQKPIAITFSIFKAKTYLVL